MATELDNSIEKSDLHMIAKEEEEKDLNKINVGGDCNGIVHDDEVKDSCDLSYVMVDNPVSESHQEESFLKNESTQEMNLSSSVEDKEDEIKVETEPDAAHVSTEDSKCEIEENSCTKEQDAVVVVEDHKESDVDENSIVDSKVVEQEDVDSKLKQVVGDAVSDSHQHQEEANLDCEIESKEDQELDSQNEVVDSVEPELCLPDDKVEEIGKLAASETAEENQDSQAQVVEVVESESETHQVNNEKEIQEELQALPEVSQGTQIASKEVKEIVETEQCQNDDGREQEEEKENSVDEIPVDGPSSLLSRENLDMEVASCPSNDPVDGPSSLLSRKNLDMEVGSSPSNDLQVEKNGESDGIQDPSTSVEQTISEPEVINESEGQERNSTCPNGEIKSELGNLNGHVENNGFCSAVELKEEMDVGVSVENGDGLSTSPKACADLEPKAVNISVEGDGNMSTSIDDVKAEAGLETGSIEENHNIPAIPDHDVERETVATNGVTGSTDLSADVVGNSQSESGVANGFASKEDFSTTATVKSDSLVSNGLLVNGEKSKSNCINDVKGIENDGEQSIGLMAERKPEGNNGVNSTENEGDLPIVIHGENNDDVKAIEDGGDSPTVVHGESNPEGDSGIENEGDISIVVHGESNPEGDNDTKSIENEGDMSIVHGESKPEGDDDTKSIENERDMSIVHGESKPEGDDDTKSIENEGDMSIVHGESKPEGDNDTKSIENEGDMSIVHGESKCERGNDVEIIVNERDQSLVVNGESKSDLVSDVKSFENEEDCSVAINSETKPTCINDVESIEKEGDQSILVDAEDKPHLVNDVTGIENEVDQSIVVNGESKPDWNGESKPECNGESKPDCKSIEVVGDQSICAENIDKPICQGDGTEGVNNNGSLSPSLVDSTDGALDGKKVDPDVEKRSFRFLIRIPRFFDDNIKAQIELAQKHVDEKTRDRDDIRSTIQSRRGICGEYRDKFEAARSEERAARDALNSKRREMDSIQLVINRMKNATSIEDIHDRIRNMEHRIEHETVPLKEEKQLIREIKQLKHLREQLSSSLDRQTELQPASDDGIKVEERFKLLKQEIESCRKEVVRLEGITKAAWKIHSDENEKLKELQAQFRVADDRRQEAYMQLQSLKKQLYEKNQYFRMYKEDAKKAEDYSFSRDRDALHHLCVNQVEMVMDLWNKNDEFRRDYVRCNTWSTLRRLRTLDGRSLGPDEESPLLRNVVDGRANNSVPVSAKKDDFPLLLASERGKSTEQDVGPVKTLSEKNSKADPKSVVSLEQKYPPAKSKTVTKPSALENSHVIISAREENLENDEEIRRTMEERELAKKAEELRKEKEAAKLKEQRRLEEKAKAKEAEERKRRNAEKAQARAQLRAQKEAELKEKEREKRARKKDRRKEKVEATGATEAESLSKAEDTQPATTEESEVQEKPKTVVKRPQKPSLLAKQIKPKVVPPPLRNRGKKRMQQWMWILLVVVLVIALFLVGNIGFSGKFGFSSLGF